MASNIPWPRFGESDGPMETLVKLSRYYGSDPEIVLAGGGNTSVKVGDRLFVKASGHSLATIGPEGFVELDRKALAALATRQLSEDKKQREEQFKAAILSARVHPEKGQRPSVEALLHHLMPRKFVVHSHSTLVNMFTCCQEGKTRSREALGSEVVWVPAVDPGFILSRALKEGLDEYRAATGKDCPRAVLMQNHGLVICGDSAEDVRKDTEWVMAALKKRVGNGESPAFGAVSRIDGGAARGVINIIAPALRGLLATDEMLKIVTFDDSPEVMEMVGGSEGQSAAIGGPLTPDQIVYCRSFPMWVEVAEEAEEKKALRAAGDVVRGAHPTGAAGEGEKAAIVEKLRGAIREHREKTGAPPQIVLVKGLGMFASGDDYSAAQTARVVYIDAIKVMAGARRMGGIHPLDTVLRKFIEDWEVEAYRKQIAAASRAGGRAAGKVAIVTGAAQGFGFEISEDLASQGACVALTDINAEGIKRAAEQLNGKIGKERTVGLAINVTDSASVEEAIRQVVRRFGGFDLLVSNAGVLKAGSVKSQPEKDFDFVTAVNYKGYFLCVQKAAPILATQHRAKSDYWSDIIQINSKSGLVGSNRNGAYAGSKFGGIGLTQSFALELVEDGIKVNAICPGNFFDGPLWSDPQNGLFAQYLRSGKVPGAKTIEEVKRFYEAKVPMGRGCTTADVMKAVYYLLDQKYETGQAVPVTGGQVMLG